MKIDTKRTISTTQSTNADLILLHPCFALGNAYDASGLLLGLAQPENANEAAAALHADLTTTHRNLPVALGVCATDPFLLRDPALRRWRQAEVLGLVNLPTVGALDGLYRVDLEASGMGYAREVELLAAAQAYDFFTVAFAFSAYEAEQMARAGVSIVILHLGWSLEGAGATSASYEPGTATAKPKPRNLAAHLREWRILEAGARKGNADVLLFLAGDALVGAEDKEALEQGLAAPDGVLLRG